MTVSKTTTVATTKKPAPTPARGPVPKDRAANGVAQPGPKKPAPAPAPRAAAPKPAPKAAPKAPAPTKKAAPQVEEQEEEQLDLETPEAAEAEAEVDYEEEAEEATAATEDDGEVVEEEEAAEEEEVSEEAAEEEPAAEEEEVLEGEVEEEEPAAPNPPPKVGKTSVREHRMAKGDARPGKEIAKRHTNNALAHSAPRQDKKPEIIKGDIIIPRLLLMQGSSQLVKDRKAQVGDIVRSTNGERVGGSNGPDKPADAVEVITLAQSASWTIMSEDGKTFVRGEPRNADNDDLPWEFEEEDKEGETVGRKRLKTIDAIVLLADDVKRVVEGGVEVDEHGIPLDLEGSVITPYSVSFKSTGFQAGKGIATHFARVEALRTTHPLTRPFHFMLPLSCSTQAEGDNEWHVFEVGGAKRTPDAYAPEARKWFDALMVSNVRIQSEEEAEATADANLEAPKAPLRRSPSPAPKPSAKAPARQSKF